MRGHWVQAWSGGGGAEKVCWGASTWSGCSVRIRLWPRLPDGSHRLCAMRQWAGGKLKGPPGGWGGAWSPEKFKWVGLGWEKGLQRAARPIPHNVCPRRAPRAREVSERLYIHRPVSTGKGGVHKKGLHWPPALGAPPPKGGGDLEKGLQAPPPPGLFNFPRAMHGASPVRCVSRCSSLNPVTATLTGGLGSIGSGAAPLRCCSCWPHLATRFVGGCSGDPHFLPRGSNVWRHPPPVYTQTPLPTQGQGRQQGGGHGGSSRRLFTEAADRNSTAAWPQLCWSKHLLIRSGPGTTLGKGILEPPQTPVGPFWGPAGSGPCAPPSEALEPLVRGSRRIVGRF